MSYASANRRPRRLRAGPASAAQVAAILPLDLIGGSTPAAASPPGSGNDVIANLFQRNWNFVVSACMNVLGLGGYGAGQVTPSEDSVSIAGHPWWEVYRPVDYSLNTVAPKDAVAVDEYATTYFGHNVHVVGSIPARAIGAPPRRSHSQRRATRLA
ncbi:hypothetical protein ACFY1B_48000 [Streptomyces mirabilis]|uniref:hypothetical protein n=1 Tax=Streptomyces TaxID=1883 RepID=UPI0029B2F046|nr:hypothetical protein [Streptomyces sp. AK02-04a]MDX3762556.1 hypothetical protein [Streptomyces sp. AK02-04a]